MPAPDHPWYGPLGKLKRPGRTISDDLDDADMKRAALGQAGIGTIGTIGTIDDETVRSARDPSYAPMTEGAAMRKPVRYD